MDRNESGCGGGGWIGTWRRVIVEEEGGCGGERPLWIGMCRRRIVLVQERAELEDIEGKGGRGKVDGGGGQTIVRSLRN